MLKRMDLDKRVGKKSRVSKESISLVQSKDRINSQEGWSMVREGFMGR